MKKEKEGKKRGKREENERKTQHINFLILNYVLSDLFWGWEGGKIFTTWRQ
jgi:hypothetical protein